MNLIKKLVVVIALIFSIFSSQVQAASIYEIKILPNNPTSTISPEMMGINGFGALVLEWGNNPKYIQNLKYMNPKHVRFHDNIQSDASRNWRAFGDETNKTWSRSKLNDFAKMIRLWRQNGINPEITITIAHFPTWMKKYRPTYNGQVSNTELLDRSEFDNYASFLAELVKILNVEMKLGIKKFEIGNELDSMYSVQMQDNGFPRKMNELAEIYNIASNRMNQIDSSIQIGGPSLTRADRTDGVREFIQTLKSLGNKNLDFFSYHTYVSGDNSSTDAFIYERITGNIKSFTRNIRSLLDANGYNLTPILLNEFNISWTDQTVDPRMTNFKGAVYDSLAYIESINEGISQVAPWADKDNVYGKMDDNFIRRPGASTLKLFSDNVKGKTISTSHNIPNFSSLGYKNTNKVGIVMVNNSNNAVSVKVKDWIGKNKLIKRTILSSDGKTLVSTATLFLDSKPLLIQSNSVVLFEDELK